MVQKVIGQRDRIPNVQPTSGFHPVEKADGGNLGRLMNDVVASSLTVDFKINGTLAFEVKWVEKVSSPITATKHVTVTSDKKLGALICNHILEFVDYYGHIGE